MLSFGKIPKIFHLFCNLRLSVKNELFIHSEYRSLLQIKFHKVAFEDFV